jgi:flagellar motor switch protein FliG
LEGESWIFAKIISENKPYELDDLFPVRFNLLLKLDDRVIQKLLREIDSQDLVKALYGENEAVHKKIFINMSKRAAEMLKEDIEYIGSIRLEDVKDAQDKILGIIRHLRDTGEIYYVT